jgi:hypothetical protein
MAATKTRKQPTQSSADQIDRATIVDRVRKIWSLAGNNPSVAEAASAAAKAAALMIQYGIVESELDESKREAYISARQAHGEYVCNCKMKLEQQLMSVVTRHMWCRVVFAHFDNNHVYADVIGQPENIEVVRYLYIHLIREIDRLGREAYRKLQAEQAADRVVGTIREPLMGMSVYIRSFRAGAIVEISDRLYDMRTAAEHAADTGDTVTALVVRKDQEADEALARLYPNLKRGRDGKGSYDRSAYLDGIQAAKSISINPALKSK